jgi:hypothetical protein
MISTSLGDEQPVYQATVRMRFLCAAFLFALMFRFDVELLHFAAGHSVGHCYVLLKTKYPMHPD